MGHVNIFETKSKEEPEASEDCSLLPAVMLQ